MSSLPELREDSAKTRAIRKKEDALTILSSIVSFDEPARSTAARSPSLPELDLERLQREPLPLRLFGVKNEEVRKALSQDWPGRCFSPRGRGMPRHGRISAPGLGVASGSQARIRQSLQSLPSICETGNEDNDDSDVSEQTTGSEDEADSKSREASIGVDKCANASESRPYSEQRETGTNPP